MAVTRARTPNLDALRLLLAVAETGSIGRAASRYGMSQPAASLGLRALELQLGLRLLHRTPTGSTLTGPGRVVVDWAAPLLETAADFTRNVATLVEGHRDRLQVAASLTVADQLIPGWLVAFHAVLPDVAVSLQPANSDQVAKMVLGGHADLGFVEGAHAPMGLRSRVVGRDDLVLVVSASHPWARRRAAVTAAELAAMPLVVRESGSGTREVLEHALRAHQLTAQSALQIGSTTAIKAAVIAGKGAAVVSRLSLGAELLAGKLVIVPTAELDLRRQFRALWRTGRVPAWPAKTLLTISLRSAVAKEE